MTPYVLHAELKHRSPSNHPVIDRSIATTALRKSVVIAEEEATGAVTNKCLTLPVQLAVMLPKFHSVQLKADRYIAETASRRTEDKDIKNIKPKTALVAVFGVQKADGFGNISHNNFNC